MTLLRTHLISGISVAALAWPMAAAAQNAMPSTEAVAAASPVAPGDQDRTAAPLSDIDTDIIVTATRRPESILKVPVSIVAYSQEALNEKGIRSPADLARATPGVTFSQGFGGITTISIRGLSSSVGSATTGVYIDDTAVQIRSLALGGNFYPAMFDLERVEVLRGPQGTLFGAGAMGGVVRFIRAQPSLSTYSGSARGEMGFTDDGAPSYEVEGAIGGPIIKDTLGFRASIYHRRDGGYIDRVPITAGVGTAKGDSNSRDTTVANLAVTLAATSRLSITPSVFYEDMARNDTDQYWMFRSKPTAKKFINGNGYPSTGRDKTGLYSVKAEYDLGGARLISNTAFIDRTTRTSDDYTSSFLELLGAPYNLALPGAAQTTFTRFNYTQRSFSQEVRLQSDNNSRLKYVVGAFYQNSRQSSIERDSAINFNGLILALTGFPAAVVFGGNTGPDGVYSVATSTSRDTQIAGFAQLDYNVTDRLTLTAGARVAHFTFDFDSIVSGIANGAGSKAGGRSSQTPVTPKAGIEYRPSDNWMLYATASKGFRQGGANPPASGACIGTQVPPTYRSDSVWSYEAGAKGRVGRVLTVAGSVFNIDWTDIQRPQTLAACGLVYLDNLGRARSRGADAQIILQPVTGLTLEASLSYTDTTYRQTIFSSPTATATTFRKGDRFGPPWAGSFAVNYKTRLGSDKLIGYSHLQFDFKKGYPGRYPYNASYDPVYAEVLDNSFMSARIGLRKGPLDFSFFVDNLLNSTDVVGRNHWTVAADRFLQQSFRPRTFGATAEYRF